MSASWIKHENFQTTTMNEQSTADSASWMECVSNSKRSERAAAMQFQVTQENNQREWEWKSIKQYENDTEEALINFVNNVKDGHVP